MERTSTFRSDRKRNAEMQMRTGDPGPLDQDCSKGHLLPSGAGRQAGSLHMQHLVGMKGASMAMAKGWYVSSVCQSCLTLRGQACQAPLPVRFSKQEYWSGLPCPPPGDLPDPGIKPISLMSPASYLGSPRDGIQNDNRVFEKSEVQNLVSV